MVKQKFNGHANAETRLCNVLGGTAYENLISNWLCIQNTIFKMLWVIASYRILNPVNFHLSSGYLNGLTKSVGFCTASTSQHAQLSDLASSCSDDVSQGHQEPVMTVVYYRYLEGHGSIKQTKITVGQTLNLMPRPGNG